MNTIILTILTVAILALAGGLAALYSDVGKLRRRLERLELAAAGGPGLSQPTETAPSPAAEPATAMALAAGVAMPVAPTGAS